MPGWIEITADDALGSHIAYDRFQSIQFHRSALNGHATSFLQRRCMTWPRTSKLEGESGRPAAPQRKLRHGCPARGQRSTVTDDLKLATARSNAHHVAEIDLCSEGALEHV